MSKAKIIASLSEELLQPILGKSGFVLYSDAKSLRPGPIYLLGHNPGGSPEDQADATIGVSLEELPNKRSNSYLDEEWATAKRSWPKGQAPLQRRVVWILRQLGFNPRNVPCSNLIFVRSGGTSGISFAQLADLCWKVHEQILEIVTPKLILVFGNSKPSPFTYLEGIYLPKKIELFPSGHGNWMCRSFKANGVTVVGLPHLSRYDIIGKHDVVQWINNQNAH